LHHIRRFYQSRLFFWQDVKNFRKRKKKRKIRFSLLLHAQTSHSSSQKEGTSFITRVLVFVRSHTPIRIRVIDSRGVSLSLSFTLAIGVIYTAYKKREQLSHREKNQHHTR
jgi:cell division protein FtsL